MASDETPQARLIAQWRHEWATALAIAPNGVAAMIARGKYQCADELEAALLPQPAPQENTDDTRPTEEVQLSSDADHARPDEDGADCRTRGAASGESDSVDGAADIRHALNRAKLFAFAVLESQEIVGAGLRVSANGLIVAVDRALLPQPAPMSNFYEPPEGARIVRVYRNGSWLEDSKLGTRTHRAWPDADDAVLLPQPAERPQRQFPIQRVGLIPWTVAERAYARYTQLHGTSQSLERLAERGGFGLAELGYLLRGYEKRKDEDQRDWDQACEFATRQILAALASPPVEPRAAAAIAGKPGVHVADRSKSVFVRALPDRDPARLIALATESAERRHWTRHTQHDFGGHQPEPFGLCAHPDCVLVRQAAIVTRHLKGTP